MGVLITLALMIVTYGSAILDHLVPHSAAISVWNAGQWPAAAILVVLALLGLYRFAPNVKAQKWKWLLPGSILATALWLLVSFVFRMYVTHAGNFGVMYGSLGALVILMFWFYLSAVSILIGGEMNAILEDSAAKRKVPGAKRRGQHTPSQEPE